MSVVIAASSTVRRTSVQRSGGRFRGTSGAAVQGVAEALDHLARLGTLQKRDEGLGRLVPFPLLEQHRVLPDRRIELLRHDPTRAGIGLGHLGQGNETDFSIARLYELVGL